MFVDATIKKTDFTAETMPYDTTEMSTRFWKAVDRKLKEARMSRAELARKARLSNQSMTSAKYLKSNVTIFTVMRITKVLGCTIEDLVYNITDSNDCRDDEYVSMFEEVTEGTDNNEISALIETFNKLKEDEQLAVLVHVFSLLGVNVKNTIKRIEDAEGIKGAN